MSLIQTSLRDSWTAPAERMMGNAVSFVENVLGELYFVVLQVEQKAGLSGLFLHVPHVLNTDFQCKLQMERRLDPDSSCWFAPLRSEGFSCSMAPQEDKHNIWKQMI
ncbi:hypothetical protein ILYODFUR_028553 [Ilyodon furcidens]|uniref:Uncharacterized protein n=1 Tax=Ilyodon furcidens TaxID=33524 RepID=A0ABV0VJI7_9TELE